MAYDPSYTETLAPPTVVNGINTITNLLPKTISSTTDWAAGTPVILAFSPSEAFKVLEVASLGTESQVLATQDIVGFTDERFRGEFYNSTTAHLSVAQNGLVVTQIAVGSIIEANLYYDGQATPDEAVVGTEIGASVILRQLSSGVWVFDKKTTPTEAAATFTIVSFACEAHTLYGRVRAMIDNDYVAFGGA